MSGLVALCCVIAVGTSVVLATTANNTTVTASAAAAAYSPPDSDRLFGFALASYCCDGLNAKGLQDWSCTVCKKYPTVRNITLAHGSKLNSNGYVAYDYSRQNIMVVFAGTDPLSIRDWIDDLNTIAVEFPPCRSSGCKVHQGFYDNYLELRDTILRATHALRIQYPSAKVQVTGHSLGAAIAVHCAIDMVYTEFIPVDMVYTYGLPRVGNSEFAKFYAENVPNNIRVTHHHDPVPHLPLEAMGFRHVKTEVFYPKNPNGTYKSLRWVWRRQPLLQPVPYRF